MKAIMKPNTWVGVIAFLVFIHFFHGVAFSGAIIIDHTCTNINQVPEYWINKAKSDFKMSYGHTSHGSQIVAGMNLLKGSAGSLYWFDHNGTDGGLSLHDYEPSGDLGNPDRTTWAERTRTMLDESSNDRNFVMWSWCGQVSSASEADINTYLTLMNQLELDYPNVTFVYMTGHLDGRGEEGNLHLRNNQIRNYCTTNGKILFDFADIESYNPDGNYFLDRGANDQCGYDGGNWADEWCAINPGECESCSCAHSRCLNCQQKGKAFWWMMARAAGWDGENVSTLYVTINGNCGVKTSCHSTIQAAIEEADTGSAILIADGTYDEAITLSSDKSLTLQGGWDTTFENQTGTTTLRNAPKAPLGSLTLQELKIQPE